MDLKIKPFRALPCALEVFCINGVKADISDFGESEDVSPETAEDYSCGDHQFIPHNHARAEVLERYGISGDEWDEIAQKLESALDVGACGWCV